MQYGSNLDSVVYSDSDICWKIVPPPTHYVFGMRDGGAMSRDGMDLNSRRDILRMGAIFYELIFKSPAFENYYVFIEEISTGKYPCYLFSIEEGATR